MEDKSSFDNILKVVKNKKTSDDIKSAADSTIEIFHRDENKVPEREKKTWCSYMENGFRVSRDVIGTMANTQSDGDENAKEKSRSAGSQSLHVGKNKPGN